MTSYTKLLVSFNTQVEAFDACDMLRGSDTTGAEHDADVIMA